MKKTIGLCLLTVVLFLCNNNTATAQCGLSGNAYYCQSVSTSVGSPSSWFDVWAAESNGYTISVNMQVYEENNPSNNGVAYADVTFGSFTWSQHIYGGGFSDSFIAQGEADVIELYAYANGGEAYIQAAW